MDAVDTDHVDHLLGLFETSHMEYEDVTIYSSGPGAYLFHGVQEQNVIYHVMKAATKMENTNKHRKHGHRH